MQVKREIDSMHMRLKRHPESPDSEKWKARKTELKKQLKSHPLYHRLPEAAEREKKKEKEPETTYG